MCLVYHPGHSHRMRDVEEQANGDLSWLLREVSRREKKAEA